MKRKKFSEFINSRGQYAAVFVFMIAVGICAGVAALNGSEDKAVEENTALNEPETPSASEPVLTEKNAPGAEVGNTEYSAKAEENLTVGDSGENNEIQSEDNLALLDGEDGLEIALDWPVDGDILLAYSPLTPLYDVTLDQYRTTDDVCIAAEAGEDVTAAAAGTVSEIVEDENRGNYVVIEHENGWATTYSQLTDITASVGETVEKGETIGKVAEPSIYSAGLGTHVEFKVTLDGRAVDPEAAIG